jgi:ferredoxin
VAFGAGWLALMKASPSGILGEKRDRLKDPRLIRPPGSLPEESFLDLCVRCDECVRVCPTNVIQPAVTEAGPEGLFTPILVPRIAECRENCNACGEICPTGAIQEFFDWEKNPRISKNPLIVGVATIDRSRCRPWYLEKACSVCDEQCPYDAIASPVLDGLKRPFVIERFCTGCGACERECPMEPESAIIVTNRIEKRPVLDPDVRVQYEETDTESADSAWRRIQGRNILRQQAREAEGAPPDAGAAGSGSEGAGHGPGHGAGAGGRGGGARRRRRGQDA